MRRYQVREDAFDVIDDDAAYWLGFIFADGCVARGNKIQVRLTADDREHLVKLRSFLQSEHPIKDLASEVVGGYTCRPSSRLDVCSTRLARRALALGRYVGELAPELASSRHFWRGVVDGDGCLRFTASGFPSFELVGPRRFMDSFLEFLRDEGLAAKMTVQPHKSIFSVMTAGHTAAAIVELLYSEAPVALTRKLVQAAAIMDRERCDREAQSLAWEDYIHRRQTARIFYLAGQSLEQVGRSLGVTNVTVLRWLRETDTPRRTRRGGRPTLPAGPHSAELDFRRTWPVAGGLAG